MDGRVQKPSDKPIFSEKSTDWRVLLGFSLTLLYLILIGMYVTTTIGWADLSSAPLADLGSFLEGAFAPLAFLWLVIGYFLQQKELAQNTDAIQMQYQEIQKSANQAVIQSRAIEASEQHARKESFLRIAESVKVQLGAIVGFLYISSQGAAGSGFVSPEKISQLWSGMSQNDPEIFSRQMLEIQFVHGEAYGFKLFFGTPIRTRHTNNFIFNFERLLKAAEDCDKDGMIKDSIIGSGHGYVYIRAIEHRDHPPEGFQVGVYDFDPDSRS